MPVKIRIYLNTFSTANTANYWLIKKEASKVQNGIEFT